MKTQVVNMIHSEYDVYIGRPGRGLTGRFGNKFKVGSDGTRDEVLVKYRADFEESIKSDPAFKKAVEALRGKRLGCFCKPRKGFEGKLLCHGQIIAGFLDGIPPEEVA